MLIKNKFIGLVGLGYWGENILRNLYDLGNLHTVCDLNQDIILERKEQYPDLNFTITFGDILQHPDIKAVVIATPASTHYDLVKQSLLAEKDVFVEKPLSLKVKEGEELANLANTKGRVLMVGHILQYHPAILKLKEIIKVGQLGKIQYIYSNRLNIGKLRTEENILWSFAPHDISVILMLLEEEPSKVTSFGGEYLNKGICDTTLTTMEFKNGVLGHIFVSWLHPFKEQKLIVVGSRAMAVFDDLSEEKLFIYPHTIEWSNGRIPVARKAEYNVVKTRKAEPLKEELKHFIECVIDRKKPETDGYEGLRVLKILEVAEESLSAKKDIIPDHNQANYFIHKSSYIDEDVKVGKNTKIWHFSHILKGSIIGNDVIIGQNVSIGADVSIGNKCKIQNNVSVYKGVTIEDEVFCGPSCVFTNVYNPRTFIERKHKFKETLIKRGTTIGANATIVCGITIGSYAMIGAGAVIKSDMPDYAIHAGVPAKQIGWACRCGETLKFNDSHATCSNCSNKYELENNKFKIVAEGIK